jgi:hypothetical protein
MASDFFLIVGGLQVLEGIRHRFVTGKWDEATDAESLLRKHEAALRGEDSEDEAVYGDFEDLETGEVHAGKHPSLPVPKLSALLAWTLCSRCHGPSSGAPSASDPAAAGAAPADAGNAEKEAKSKKELTPLERRAPGSSGCGTMPMARPPMR